MKIYNKILGAETEPDPVKELIDIMEDDFSYFMTGLKKLQRDGGEDAQDAYDIAIQLNDAIQSAIASISELQID